MPISIYGLFLQMEFIPEATFLKIESVRLDTFHCWSIISPVRPDEFARQGFFYTGKNDSVKCYFCEGQLNQWTAGDVVSIEHSKWYPDCPFVQGKDCGNVPMLKTHIEHPPYIMFYDRMESFQGWHKAENLAPDRMASAGFFQITPFDHVKCFCCGVRLNKWVADNDPWEEHKKFSPDCQFLIERNGYYLGYNLMIQLAAFTNLSLTKKKRTRRDPQPESEYRLSQPESEYRLSQPESEYRLSQPESEYRLSQPESEYHLSQQETSTQQAAESTSETQNNNNPLLQLATFTAQSQSLAPSGPPQAKAGASKDLFENLDDLGTEELKQIILEQEDERLCKICFERKLKVIFQPCNHMVCCAECGELQRNCPICRTQIQKTNQIYFS